MSPFFCLAANQQARYDNAPSTLIPVDPILATLLILALAIVAFVSNRIPLGVVAIGVALALFGTGVLTLDQALAGFGDPTVLFIASLFVVSESLDSTGVTAWAGQRVIAHAGTSKSRMLVIVCLLSAALTALISVNGAVAALLPLVVVVSARTGITSSKLLMPLAFAAHAGSLLLLTGTPVNIIVSELAATNGGRAFGFAEFAIVGVPLLILSVLLMLLIGRFFLPTRSGTTMPLDLMRHARMLRNDYSLDLDTGLILGHTNGISEVVVPPRSDLVGVTVSPGMATPSGDLVVLAARRGDAILKGQKVVLQVGDTLLLQGSWNDLERHTAAPGMLVVDSPAVMRRSIPLGLGARRALIILAAMIVALATGVVPPAVVTLIAAATLVLTRTVSVTQAYQSISWTTVVLVAGMLPLSTAFLTTGTADLVAGWMLTLIGDSGPQIALAVICIATLLLGQVISNTATIFILAPIAVSVAASMQVSVQPFMMALAIVGAASFLTPIATPANLMVMGPGGYRFGDYWKFGLPLALLFLAFAVFYVPMIWAF